MSKIDPEQLQLLVNNEISLSEKFQLWQNSAVMKAPSEVQQKFSPPEPKDGLNRWQLM